MQADHIAEPPRCRRDGVEIEIRRVGGEHSARPRRLVEATEHVGLDGEILEHRLDDEVDAREGRPVGGAGDARHARLGLGAGEAAAFHLVLVEAAQAGRGSCGRIGIALDQHHGEAGVGERRRNAGPHGAAADDGQVPEGAGGDAIEAGHLGGLAFGEEEMAQGFGLGAFAQLQEGGAFARKAVAERRIGRRPNQLDGAGDGRQPLGALDDIGGCGIRVFAAGGDAHARQPALGDRRRQRAGGGQEVRLHDVIQDPGLQCLTGGENFSLADQPDGRRDPGQARQALGAAGARYDAEPRLGQAEGRGRRGEPAVASERDLEPAAQGRSVDGGDHGNVEGFDRRHHLGQVRRLGSGIHFADVGAGDEAAGSAGDHDCGYVAVRSE